MAILVRLDRERHIRLDSNALADIEQVFNDAPMGELLRPSRLGVQVIRAILWAGLRHEDPKITLRQAGDLMDLWMRNGGRLDDLAAKMNDAILEAGFRVRNGDGKADQPPAVPGAAEADLGPFASGSG